MIPGTDPVHKVTIIPRGRALGITSYLPLDEKHTYAKDYLEGMLAKLLGGRAAEKVVFDRLTTGAGNDIERATDIARKMVCEWGMSSDLGPISFGKKEQEIFLGREIAQHRDYSEETARAIDDEVSRIVRESEQTAEKIINDNLDELHALADALLVHELLDGEQIDAILRGESIDRAAFSNKPNDKTESKSPQTKEKKARPKRKSPAKEKKPAKNSTVEHTGEDEVKEPNPEENQTAESKENEGES
jgi:cell division protease FtsH